MREVERFYKRQGLLKPKHTQGLILYIGGTHLYKSRVEILVYTGSILQPGFYIFVCTYTRFFFRPENDIRQAKSHIILGTLQVDELEY